MFKPLALLSFIATLFLPVTPTPQIELLPLEITRGWRVTDDMPTNWWDVTTIEEVEEAFNAARAFEEPDLPLLDIPYTTDEWLTLSLDERALWLINQERTARELVPLDGVADTMHQLAQEYADLLYTSNEIGHFANETHPYTRIDEVLGVNCRDSDYVNNLAFLSTGTPFASAVSVFLWTYSSNLHRDMVLERYNDDTFESGSEGYLGIGFAQGVDWTVYDDWELPTIVVLEMYDPAPECFAHLTPTNTPLPTSTPTLTPTNTPTHTPLPTNTPTLTPTVTPTNKPIPPTTVHVSQMGLDHSAIWIIFPLLFTLVLVTKKARK